MTNDKQDPADWLTTMAEKYDPPAEPWNEGKPKETPSIWPLFLIGLLVILSAIFAYVAWFGLP